MKHLTSFLFLLSAVAKSRSFDCMDTNSCSCTGNTAKSNFEISCPISDEDVRMELELHHKLTIQCTLKGEQFDLENISNYTIGPVETVEFKYCPMPTNNFSEIFNVLNVQMKSLSFITMEDNRTFKKDMFADLGDLEWLRLNGDKIEHIQPDLFRHLSKLKVLNLNNNDIGSLAKETFDYIPNVIDIELSSNKIKDLEPSLFHPLKKLRRLHLFKNDLQELPVNVFKECSELQELEMSNNPLTRLDENQFSSNPKLEVLSLKSTRIKELPNNIFNNNSELRIIHLDRNDFSNFTDRNFATNLTKLTNITLRFCQITDLHTNFFQGCSNLLNIQISDNKLQNLPDGIFSELIRTEILNLSNNQLKELQDNVFDDLWMLQVLYLNSNHLGRISDQLFKNLKQLIDLDLSNNRIQFVAHNAFESLNKLRILRLSNNQLGKQFQFPRIINPCVKLEYIDLQNNRIEDIDGDFIVYTHLEAVNLADNNLKLISRDQLELISDKHAVLDFQNNNITEIDFKDYEIYSEPSTDATRTVYLSGNPLNCDCNLYDFVRYLHEKKSTKLTINDDMFCNAPKNLQGASVTSLALDKLLCSVEQCPNSCECFRSRHDKSYIVNCSNKNLTAAPKLEMIHDNINHTVLNLTGNSMEMLPEMDDGYFNVTRLYLGSNKLKELKWIPPRIEVLTLNNNALRRVDEKIIAQLNRSSELKHLSFENNPWICDCSTAQFSNFLRHQFTSNRIMGKNIKCAHDGRLLIDLNSKNLCRNTSQILLASGLVLLSLLAIVLVLTALYYRFTQEVKVWLFAHNIFLWFVTEEELDKDKLYDAFVSFAHQDQQFISQELLPVLEHGPERYKLCLHLRDWIGGEAIMNQIAYSVENSRRTIVILSENFLKSAWATTEFRLAHQKALRERRARIIVIIYGDVNPEEIIDEELKAYLRTNTYVKWGDPWFWDKIKYAMPHSYKLWKMHKRRLNNVYANIDNMDLLPQTPSTPSVLESTPPIEITLNPLLLKERQNQNSGSLGNSSPVEENNRQI